MNKHQGMEKIKVNIKKAYGHYRHRWMTGYLGSNATYTGLFYLAAKAATHTGHPTIAAFALAAASLAPLGLAHNLVRPKSIRSLLHKNFEDAAFLNLRHHARAQTKKRSVVVALLNSGKDERDEGKETRITLKTRRYRKANFLRAGLTDGISACLPLHATNVTVQHMKTAAKHVTNWVRQRPDLNEPYKATWRKPEKKETNPFSWRPD